MVWINKDTGVVLSKDGHTLFVDLVAEDEERERLAERSGLADPHGDMPDKEYLEAAVIIHDDAALAEYRESGYSAYEGGMSMTGYQTRGLSDIKAFISYIASSPDCPATTTLRSWAEYEDLSDHAGFLTDLLDEARGRLDGFGLSGPECGAGMDADVMGVQGPAR